MRSCLAIFAAAAWCVLNSGVQAADPIPPSVRLLVPAYFYPTGEGLRTWKTLIQSAAKVPTVAIVNPGSGPGKAVDPNYRSVFDLAKNSRITLIGYVTLSYAKRPVEEVQADIDQWVIFYPEIRGIFFDEQPSSAEHLSFVEKCVNHAQSRIRNARLISNPGTICAREYLDLSGSMTVCMFENREGFEKYKLPKWADPLPPHRFAILHYEVKSVDEMRRVLQTAMQQRAGYVFITDRQAPMPWSGLPDYWQEELDLLMKANRLIDMPLEKNKKR
jgi:hypothetical protein